MHEHELKKARSTKGKNARAFKFLALVVYCRVCRYNHHTTL